MGLGVEAAVLGSFGWFNLVFVPPLFCGCALGGLVVHQILVGALNAITTGADLALLAADGDLNSLAQVKLEGGLIDGQSRLLKAWSEGAPDSP